MDLNIRTEVISLPITMESGIVLNVQVPQPVVLQTSQIAFAEWGKIVGDINNQPDLMAKLNKVEKLQPTAELDGSTVLFHFITLTQMEKMHVRASGVGSIGFALTKGENNFELRFSADSPQEIAGQLIFDDSIEIVDDVFGTITIPLEGYVVSGVYIDGVDANLLEADINWRLADLRKHIESAPVIPLTNNQVETIINHVINS